MKAGLLDEVAAAAHTANPAEVRELAATARARAACLRQSGAAW